jgi:hypothetical protein
MAKAWWRKTDKIKSVDVYRNGENGIRVSVFEGDEEQDPVLQLANLWFAPSQEWVVIKRQPVLTYEDILANPKAAELISKFLHLVEAGGELYVEASYDGSLFWDRAEKEKEANEDES